MDVVTFFTLFAAEVVDTCACGGIELIPTVLNVCIKKGDPAGGGLPKMISLPSIAKPSLGCDEPAFGFCITPLILTNN